MSTRRLTFAQLNDANPCEGCPAPCCRTHIVGQEVPRTFSDLDHIRYSLLFPGMEILVSSAGAWSLARWQDCTALEVASATCSLHGTSAKPRICAGFSPYDCWYKRNFVTDAPPDVYRLNLARFEVWLGAIGFDDDGVIVSAPSFEEAQELVKDVPVTPTFRADPRLHKPDPGGRGQARESAEQDVTP